MNLKNSLVCLLLLFVVTETALAWPRLRRGRQSYSSSGNSSYGQVYDDQYLDLPASSAAYNWEAIEKIDATDYIPIVLDEAINGKLEVKLTCLNNSADTHTIQAELKDGRAEVRHGSIKPGTMYRLCATIDGKQRIRGPYFTATSGDNVEARGRRRIDRVRQRRDDPRRQVRELVPRLDGAGVRRAQGQNLVYRLEFQQHDHGDSATSRRLVGWPFDIEPFQRRVTR